MISSSLFQRIQLFAKINIIISSISIFSFGFVHSSTAYFYKGNVATNAPFLGQKAIVDMQQAKAAYIYQLKRWCTSDDVEAYTSVFFNQRLEKQFEMSVCFDDRIIDPICELIKHHDYIQFTSRPSDRCILKSRLRKVVEILGEHGFITQGDQQMLTFKMNNYYLKSSINQFIEAAQRVQQQKNPLLSQEVDRIWKNTIHKNVDYFWMYMIEHKIIDSCLIKLIDFCQPSIKHYSITKINQIEKYYELVKKHLNPTTTAPTIQELFSPNQSANKAYNQRIDKFITERSLFLNPERRNVAYQQIRDIIATISCGNYIGGTLIYDLYGSIKTGFAIAGFSDADIHITPPGQSLSRDEKIHYLLQISKTLTINSLNKLNYFIQPYINQKIKVPFIKMKLDKTANCNHHNMLKSIDIIIDTRSGIENSKILAMYSQSQYILKFGNLVKLWAKKKTIINAKKPTQGLSSYGVLLMALFYLIKVKQAPYVIQAVDGYRLEKSLLGERDYKPLLDNLKGFLDFYRPNGPFFTENMIVCLKEKPKFTGHYYDKYLINMYDFVDGSNPGRLSKHSCDKFFSTITRTYALLLGHHDMHEVMKYQE